MTFKLLSRVRLTSTGAAGTGAYPINTAVPGFQTLAQAGLSFGDTTSYIIEDGNPLGTAWEFGVGTYNSNGTFSRTTIAATSNQNTSPLTLSANAVLSATFLPTDLGGPETLEQLQDVSISSLATSQVLTWNGSAWVNETPATGVSALSALSDVSLSSPTSGQFLKYDGAHWVNAAVPGGVTALSGLSDVSLTSLTTGQVLTWNGSAWTNETSSSGGTTPTVVQYATVQQTSTGSCLVTLGSAPTPGNILIAIGAGGGSVVFGDFAPGFSFSGADQQYINSTGTTNDWLASYGYRVVRSGDGTSWSIGNISSGAPGFGGVILEVANFDPTKFGQWMLSQGYPNSSAASSINALASSHTLSVVFGLGATNTLSMTTPSSPSVNHSDGTTTLLYNAAAATQKYAGATLKLGSNVGYSVTVLNLPG